MYFICQNCGEYTRIHKKSNYCWKCGSDKITSADSKVEAEKAKWEAVGKQDTTAVSGRAKGTPEKNTSLKALVIKKLGQQVELLPEAKNPMEVEMITKRVSGLCEILRTLK